MLSGLGAKQTMILSYLSKASWTDTLRLFNDFYEPSTHAKNIKPF